MKHLYRILLLSLFCTGSLFAGPDDYVEWKPVPGAAGYQVQVREAKTKTVLVDQTVEGTMLDVNLKPGMYESRVAPLSPFGRPILWSDWRQLNVLIARSPIVDEHPKVVVESGRPVVVVMTGSNFARSMRVSLKNDAGTHVVPDRKVNDSGTEVIVVIPPGKFPQGDYDLVLENPRQKTAVFPGLVSIKVAQEVAAKIEDKPGQNADKQTDKTAKTDKTGDKTTQKQNGDKTDKKTDKTQKLDQVTQGDYREYLRTLPSTCKGSGLPDFIIKRCYKYHLVLDLSTPAKTDMHQYLLAYQGNFAERMTGYNYFRTTCGAMSGQVKAILEERLEMSRESMEAAERETIQHTLEHLKACNAASDS
jgi:hypothetical protein